MKKVLGFTLVVSMLFTLAGCSSSPTPSSGTASGTVPSSAASGGSAVSNASTETLTIKLGHAMSENSVFHKACLNFKDAVKNATNGRITIEVYSNAALGSESEMAEGLTMGTIDAALMGPSSVTKLDPKFDVFNLPYLFKNAQQADAVFLGKIGDQFADEIYSTSGVKTLSFWESGFRYYTNNKKEVEKPEDMAGLLIRIPSSEVQAATLKALGASSTNLAIAEVYTACSNHTIDGEESPVDTIVSNTFYEVQKYMVMDGHVYAPMSLLMSGKLFDSMTKEDQQALLDCARESGVYERKEGRANESTQLELLKKSGMIISENVDKAAWRKAVQPVYDKYYSVFGKDLINSIENTTY